MILNDLTEILVTLKTLAEERDIKLVMPFHPKDHYFT